MSSFRACVLLLLASTATGARIKAVLTETKDDVGFDLPPALAEKLAGLLSDENLPALLAQIPEEQRAMVEKFVPLIQKNAPALIEAVMGEMTADQQQKVMDVAKKVANGEPGEDFSGLVQELAQDIVPTLQKNIQNPEFIAKVVSVVAQDGDGLKSLLHSMLGEDKAGLVEPLIDFMSLDGLPALDNLDRMKDVADAHNLMDGPLRTLFLLSNVLAYSTGVGATFGSEETEDTKAYPVVDADLKKKADRLFLVPKQWMQGVELICSVLKLKFVGMEVLEDVLLEPDEADQEPGAILYTLRMTLESTDGRKVVIHSVRTGVGAKNVFSISDLYMLMGLYEEPIRNSFGFFGFGKYLSLPDIIYKLTQKLASWDWLIEKVGKEENQTVQTLAGFDDKRKLLRTRLADGIKSTTAAGDWSGETNTMHLFTGVSLGGSIARMKAMVAKLECESCPIVALTLNAPSIYGIVQKLGLDQEEVVEKTWWQRQKDAWFSTPLLEEKSALFGSFVNFVAQHGVFWKLDDPLPGSRTCMYMHPAERTGCQGVTKLGDLYTAVWSALWKCRKDSLLSGLVTEGLMDTPKCVMGQLAPAYQCAVQEHAFILSGGLSLKDALSGGMEGGMEQLSSSFDMQAVFSDIVKTFSESSQAETSQDINWLNARTGHTVTVPLQADEQAERDAARKSMSGTVMATLSNAIAEVEAKYDALDADVAAKLSGLPVCTGCGDEWCAEHDIRAHRYCGGDPADGREQCREDPGETGPSETCSGALRFIKNFGRECMCSPGHCWNGNECAADPHDEQRRTLTQSVKSQVKHRNLEKRLANFQADEQRKAFETAVVKDEDDKDAKPDPAFDGKWACTA